MPTRAAKLLTVGSLVAADKGVTLHCACGHKTALLPAQVAEMAHPRSSLLDFKRRFRCTMCSRSGSSDEIRIATFDVAPAIAAGPQTNLPRARQ